QLVIGAVSVVAALAVFASGTLTEERSARQQVVDTRPPPPVLEPRLIATGVPGWYEDPEQPMAEHYFDGRVWLASRWKGFPQLVAARPDPLAESVEEPSGIPVRQLAWSVAFVLAVCAA